MDVCKEKLALMDEYNKATVNYSKAVSFNSRRWEWFPRVNIRLYRMPRKERANIWGHTRPAHVWSHNRPFRQAFNFQLTIDWKGGGTFGAASTGSNEANPRMTIAREDLIIRPLGYEGKIVGQR